MHTGPSVEQADHVEQRGTAKSDDTLPQFFVDATYFINMANLKGHAGGALTFRGKNHYGSLCRRPDAPGFCPRHVDLPSFTSGWKYYRALVDLMGHGDTGGKGLLYLIDGLRGTRDALVLRSVQTWLLT